jgi:hypothetical protein
MGFEPQKFFIGLINFFAIWVPGALLTFLAGHVLAAAPPWPPMDVADWIVFLLVSYLAGHFVFALGSLLDRPVYDYLRRGTRDRQLDLLASGERICPRPVRWLSRIMFEDHDEALVQARRMRDEALSRAGASDAVNAFQWCKAKLALEHRDALADVERFEADSKFFRSLTIIVAIIAIIQIAWVFDHLPGIQVSLGPVDWPRSAGAFLLESVILVFALWRYLERRYKAITKAYWLVLTAHPQPAWQWPALAEQDAPTHAGGLVLRRAGKMVEYLRVLESEPSPRWVLPKGYIETGEKPECAAVRGVLKQAAIWARIEAPLAAIAFGRMANE